MTTEEAALLLNRARRTVLDLIETRGIATDRNGPKGTMRVDAEAIRKVKAERDAPRQSKRTIDVGAGKTLAKRDAPVPASRPAELIGGLASLAQHFAKLGEFQASSPKPHQWVTLREAARLTGLSPTLLDTACEQGRLSYVIDGPPSKQRRMVKIEDLFALRF